MPNTTGSFVAAIIIAIVILGGLYAVGRNVAIFLAESLKGQSGRPWYNRPYLFRAVAWAFTLFWIFGPYSTLRLETTQVKFLAYALYLVAAAAWLWVLRVNYLTGIPQQVLAQGPSWGRGLGWGGHAGITYLVQLLCAAGLGGTFLWIGSAVVSHTITNIVTVVALLVFLLITAAMSSWRISLLAGPDHTFREHLQHIVGGPDAGPPHHYPAVDSPPPPRQS